MNPFRVLHLCSAREYVGEAAHVIELMERLLANGHAAELVAREGYSVALQASRLVLPCTRAEMSSRFSPLRDLADIRLLRRRLDAFRPDIVHVHRGKEHWLAAAALWRRRGAPPLVRTRHVMTPIRNHAANRWLFGRATQGLVCVSDAVRAEVARSEGFIRCPIRTITGGVNPARLKTAPPETVEAMKRHLHIPEGAPVVSCLARLAPVKGQEYLLRAIPAVRLCHPGAVFVFAFPRASEYRVRLEELAAELRIRESLRWVGSPDHLGSFFGISDIGVLSSIGSEGWSRAVNEYMYFGRPVVAAAVGCLSQLVEEGETGYLVPPRDPVALARALIRLLDSPDEARRMGARAAARAREEFTIDRSLEHLLGFYGELLAAGAP